MGGRLLHARVCLFRQLFQPQPRMLKKKKKKKNRFDYNSLPFFNNTCSGNRSASGSFTKPHQSPAAILLMCIPTYLATLFPKETDC